MTHRSSLLIIPTILGFLATAPGCAPKIAIRSMEPGPVSLGAVRDLAILHGEGRRSARELVYLDFIAQCRARGYFTVVDRSEEGTVVRIAGRRAVLEGNDNVLDDATAGVRLDVLEWNAYRESKDVSKVDAKGNRYSELVRTLTGRVLLAVSVFDVGGRTFLAEKEYEGVTSTTDSKVSRDEAIESAASQAVSRLVADITPFEVVQLVTLDNDEPALSPFLQTAQAGNVAQAAKDLRSYLDRNPTSAAAAYNLAVCLEALGEFETALAMYDKALSLGNKAFFSSARANCARRLAARQALQD